MSEVLEVMMLRQNRDVNHTDFGREAVSHSMRMRRECKLNLPYIEAKYIKTHAPFAIYHFLLFLTPATTIISSAATVDISSISEDGQVRTVKCRGS